MEVWKIIVLVIWAIWTVSVILRSPNVFDGYFECPLYVVIFLFSMCIIVTLIDWSWLFIKI